MTAGNSVALIALGGNQPWHGTEPADVLNCGNSGTSLRLTSGMLAGLPMYAVLDGDASLRSRPVARIIHPLRSMGASLS